MITLQEQSEKIKKLASMHASSQIDKYAGSIFLPYITLPNAKGKGAMMEEFFEWYLNELGIKTKLIKTNENYDFICEDKIKVELKVASIGLKDVVSFNQIHYGLQRQVDKFLFTIIKPDDTIDFFVIPKVDFMMGNIKLQKQHTDLKNMCARISWPYNKMLEELAPYKVNIDKLKSYIV